jgi:hypothetical protein
LTERLELTESHVSHRYLSPGYVLTVGGAIYAYRMRKIPTHRPGDFSLGRWFVPVAVAAFAYAAGVV